MTNAELIEEFLLNFGRYISQAQAREALTAMVSIAHDRGVGEGLREARNILGRTALVKLANAERAMEPELPEEGRELTGPEKRQIMGEIEGEDRCDR
jgi:hypothetical protein